jgi:hypothetical protein
MIHARAIFWLTMVPEVQAVALANDKLSLT